MKVGFDYQIFIKQSYGGISRYFVSLARELLICGEEVKIFASVHRNKYLASAPRAVVDGRYLKKFSPFTSIIFAVINFFIFRVQVEKWAPNIIHQTYYLMTFRSRADVKIVLTVYDMIHEIFPKNFGVLDATSFFKKSVVKRSDHIICISENTKQDLIRIFSVPENKISVVYLGVDDIFFNNDIKKSKIFFEKPYLLYVGQRGGYKNFTAFIEAVASSPVLLRDFNIIAFGGGQFSRTEKKLIESLGYRDQQLLQIDGDDKILKTYYTNARVFVYPSLYEGFGIPPLEAMASGCPVVASNRSSIPEILSDGAEYFDPFNKNSIVQAIESVVYSTSRMAELRKNGFNVSSLFTWQRCAKETLAVYKKISECA